VAIVALMRSNLGAIAVAVAIVTLVAGAGPAAARPLSAADRQFVDSTVAQFMQSARLPGVSILITGPKGTLERTYGVGDIETNAPLAFDDHLRIASITKSFTATAVLQQVERGRLKLSDKLERFVTGIPNGKRITVRQVIGMQSGVYDFTADPTFDAEFDANPLLNFGPEDAVRIIRAHPPDFAPGSETRYADSNYILAGLILEQVTHRSPGRIITDDIIRRLRLRHTSFPATPVIPSPFAHGYFTGEDGMGPLADFTAVNPKVPWTAGAMISTLADLRKWAPALATGRGVLSPKLQRLRVKLGSLPNPGGVPAGYGLGILGFGDWLGHNGAIFGFSTAVFYLPTNGATIVVAGNNSSNSSTPATSIFATIARHLYPASLRSAS
jgi:D-alanyl-D-alanine carboxypeptidase